METRRKKGPAMPLNFRDDLAESLKDPKEAKAFLDAALEEDDPATVHELLRLLAQSKRV